MSLLIKALEQAARDRDSAKGDRTPPASSAAATPSLEPTLEPAPVRAARPREAAPPLKTSRDGASAPGTSTPPLALDTPVAARRSAAVPSTAQVGEQERARAAAVLQASAPSGHWVFAYVRSNPVMMFGGVAGVFGVAFGIYVYLQIAQPGLFVRSAAVSPAPSQPVSSRASTELAVSTADSSVGVAAPNVSSNLPGRVEKALPRDASESISSNSVNRAPISSASVIAAGASDAGRASPAPRYSAEQADASSRADNAPTPLRTDRAKPVASAADTGDTIAARRERIAVNATAAQPRVNPLLAQAYTALQGGNLEEARGLYAKLIQSEPLNVDGLLGSAYVAAQENRSDDAMALYLRILQINPRQASAQAALIGLMGKADPIASETRLKQLIAREPSAFLHFVLGNLYADQSLWSQAQQAYFQSHNLEPNNPDYAYNLAIGLDHLRQRKLALSFYTRAEQLATAAGRANFNVAHARERIGILTSQLD